MKDTANDDAAHGAKRSADVQHDIEPLYRLANGLLVLKVGDAQLTVEEAAFTLPRISGAQRKERDAEFLRCVKAGMTVKQLTRFSESWLYPLRTRQQVERKLRELKCSVKKRQLPHEEDILDFLVDWSLPPDGWRMTDWEKERTFGGVRADLWLRFQRGKKWREFCYERQRTSKENVSKINKYLYLSETRKEAFRVLLHFDSERRMHDAIEYANRVMDRERPDLELFLFSVNGRRWYNRWGRKRSLL